MKTLSKLGLTLTLVFALVIFASSTGFTKDQTEREYDQYLIKALADENLGIRSSAAQLLGERKVEEAIKPLARMMKTDTNYAVRIVAAVALYQIGNEEVLPVFKECFRKDRNRTVKHVLAGIIYEMEHPKYASNK